MCGLVDHIFPDVFGVFESPGQTLSGLFSVLRPFLLTGECPLPPSPAPLLLLHPALLDGGEIDPSPIARHHRRHHTPVESNGFAPEFLFRKHLKKQEEEKQNRPLDPLLPFGLRRGIPGQMFKFSLLFFPEKCVIDHRKHPVHTIFPLPDRFGCPMEVQKTKLR